MSARRSLLISLILYGFLLIGLATFHGPLIAATIPLLLYMGTSFLRRPTTPSLQITRTLSRDYATPDAEIEVYLSIANQGRAMEEIALWDQVPEGLKVTGDTSAILSLAPGETFTLTYSVRGPRGTYRFLGTTVRAGEHFGLMQKYQRYNCLTKLSIVPAVPRMRRVLVRPLRTRVFAGPYPARHGGPGTDFYGVRSYQPGDPPSRINWRLTARHVFDLFTDEFEREQIADIGIILDARARTDVAAGTGEKSLFEYAVQAAAALSDVFLADGNRVGLIIYGRGLERTFPGYGRHQRQRILWALAHAQTGDSLVFDNLDYLPTRFFPAKSQIVLVSPLCEDDPTVLMRLRARGYQVLVVSPNPVAFEAAFLPPGDLKKLALRIANVERTLLIRKLQRVGIPVVDWDVDQPLDAAVARCLSRFTITAVHTPQQIIQ